MNDWAPVVTLFPFNRRIIIWNGVQSWQSDQSFWGRDHVVPHQIGNAFINGAMIDGLGNRFPNLSATESFKIITTATTTNIYKFLTLYHVLWVKFFFTCTISLNLHNNPVRFPFYR